MAQCCEPRPLKMIRSAFRFKLAPDLGDLRDQGHHGTPWDTSHRKHQNSRWYDLIRIFTISINSIIYLYLYHSLPLYQNASDYNRLYQRLLGFVRILAWRGAWQLFARRFCCTSVQSSSEQRAVRDLGPLGWEMMRARAATLHCDFGKWFTCNCW